jgi:hypothetical protein
MQFLHHPKNCVSNLSSLFTPSQMTTDFYLGLVTGMALVNWKTISYVGNAVAGCCVRNLVRNLNALDIHLQKAEFHQYMPDEEPIVPKAAWDDDVVPHDKDAAEQAADESDGDLADTGAESEHGASDDEHPTTE